MTLATKMAANYINAVSIVGSNIRSPGTHTLWVLVLASAFEVLKRLFIGSVLLLQFDSLVAFWLFINEKWLHLLCGSTYFHVEINTNSIRG